MGWDGTTTIEGYAIPTPEIHYFDLNDVFQKKQSKN
jgi:hypothetical protein